MCTLIQSRKDVKWVLYSAMYESIAAHSRLGINVVVDVGHHDAYAIKRGILVDCARRLNGLPVLFVGVRCPIEVIMERRLNTGWNLDSVPGSPVPAVPRPVELWQSEVHIPGIYDMEVDTSLLSSAECASLIRQQLRNIPTPSAFQRLAALSAN